MTEINRRHFTAGCLASLSPSLIAAKQPPAMPADHYDGELILKPLPGRLMELKSRFGYTEAAGRNWTVPPGAVVDGASIPRVFWTVVGGPWDGEYRDASIIHDWYCAVRVQPWRDTHAMFYHAMIRSGVELKKARLLYLAVYYAGPSWDDLTIANNRLLTKAGSARRPGDTPKSREKFAFDNMMNFEPPADAEGAAGLEGIFRADRDTGTLKDNLRELAEQANAKDFDLNQMNSLVDKGGRREKMASELAEAGNWG